MRIVFVCLLSLLLAACAIGGADRHKLDRTLYAYQSAIRWEGLDKAAEFLDPTERERLAPSALERQRFEQYQVSGYYAQGQEQADARQVLQIVEIRLINRHTQVERSVIDRQRWRWDSDAKRWWLVSGLPQITAR
jgi:hypothetical protein